MNKKLLLLDDDYNLRFNLKLYLTDEGFECYEFENAEDALSSLSELSIDLAIVDIRLPGMNGEEFIREANKINPNLLFLIYTGSADYVLPEDLKERGILDSNVLHKPVEDMSFFVRKINGFSE